MASHTMQDTAMLVVPGAANYTRGAAGGSLNSTTHLSDRESTAVFSQAVLPGHVYGAEGIWGADIEPTAPVHMWEAFQWRSGAQMQYLRTFAFSIGRQFQDLVPIADLVSPDKTQKLWGTKAGRTAPAPTTRRSSLRTSKRVPEIADSGRDSQQHVSRTMVQSPQRHLDGCGRRKSISKQDRHH